MDFGHRKLVENYKDKYTKEDEFLSQKNNFSFLFEAVFICILHIKVKKTQKFMHFVCRNTSTAANKGTPPYFLCLCNSVVCTGLDL